MELPELPELPINYDTTHQSIRKLVREEYVRLQDGLCHFCKQPLDGPPLNSVKKLPVNKALFPKGFFNSPVHLHHDHNTHMTIGAIHSYCNAVLWCYYNE